MKKQTQHILLTVLTPILIALGVFTLLSVAIPKVDHDSQGQKDTVSQELNGALRQIRAITMC